MKNPHEVLIILLLTIAIIHFCGCSSGSDGGNAASEETQESGDSANTDTTKRVPAEFEPHAATWLQWPTRFEASYRDAFVRFINVIQEYEPVIILCNNDNLQNDAEEMLTNGSVPFTNITFKIMPNESAWMRDNGPVYVVENGANFGNFPTAKDDAIPSLVAEDLGMACEKIDNIILEKGNLEFNGVDTLILNWIAFSDRAGDNPTLTKEEAADILKDKLGVTKVVWLLNAPPSDLTGGHVDGIARFIDADTVVVAKYVDQTHAEAWIYEEAADIIKDAGFEVLRMDIPGEVTYKNIPMSAIYMNWLVGNGFVVTTGFAADGNEAEVNGWDEDARTTIAGYFPDRDVYVVDTLASWYNGGGIHCHTNDQPALSITD